jgi:hypothetical protein
MSKVSLEGEEVKIELGHGIIVYTTSDGVNRANRVEIDESRYVHNEIYEILKDKHENLFKNYANLNGDYQKANEKIENLKLQVNDWQNDFYRVKDIAVEKTIQVDRWKRRFIYMGSLWFFTALALLCFI